MLDTTKNRYFEIIRDDVFTKNGTLAYDNYLEEFQPYAVSQEHTKYANYGAIQLLDFGLKGEHEASNERKDKRFQKRYEKAKEHISHELLGSHPLLETYISDELSYSLLSPFLRNLTYGKSLLTVWIHEGETYALVFAGKGESACNLLFFCRVENK
jgi:hypothetical protein